jgi:hypothetical protein
MSETKNDEKRQEYITAIRKWYSDEYLKTVNLNSLENKAARDFLQKADLNVWSHKNRIAHNVQIIKHTFLCNKTDMITTCFKVGFDATSCIYGYLHSQFVPGKKPDIVHKFVCTGPTFRSQDGEYRNRLISWVQFQQLFDKYGEIFEQIEKAVIDKIEQGSLTFQTDFYYPAGFTYGERKFEDMINNLRLPIKFYILCWAHDYYAIHNKIVENHVNPAYQYIFYQPDDKDIFESILGKIGQVGYWELQSRISRHYANVNDLDHNLLEPQCGQKIFPLSVFEAIRHDDIHFNVWREIYITNMATNLVLNLISPSFPFINNWFYIQSAHGGLFDNIAMHDKYAHSSIAENISSQLKNTDKLNYVNNDRTKGFISNKFAKLSRALQKSIVYADSDIRLTELAVCMTSEYVGRTLRDLPILIANKEHLPGLDLSFTDTHIFTKHMFEYVYAFYCMNSKIGMMHGDLHMNNATIGRLYHMTNKKNIPYVKDPHIAFIIDSEVYMFKHVGLFSIIIDFSRAILGDHARLEHEFSERFAEQYFKDQRTRVLQMIYHYFPKLMNKYKDKIEVLLTNSYPLMFKILTAIDTYVIMSNIAAMFGLDDAFTHGKIKIAPGAINLLKKLSTMAEHLVVSNIRAAIEGRISSPDDIEWPNLLILQKNFTEYKLTPERMKESVTVVDIFNSNNDIVSDIDDYDSWGPLLSLEKEIELRKKYGQKLHKGIMEWLDYKQKDESVMIDSLTTKYEQQEREVLQYEPWMLI